ncbi:MAG: class I SAM-dependent methyltransferase, partial [Lachnospiraceae bacterium]|nr:class I SAM-dependent methyltransferase [Lachnospiraceae bacterium]
MQLAEKKFIRFMRAFDAHPFEIALNGNRYLIGQGEPEFKVTLSRILSVKELMTGTSLALGEAYMGRSLEIKGDLYEAQCNKAERILEKLHLSVGMSLCDIGCGWGFLLILAAKQYHVHGVGITLSTEQAENFRERIKTEHLEDLLEVKLMDYRDLPGTGMTFDRVVSIGMLEHVGRGNYEEYMNCMKSLLKPGGLFLLHFIS